MNTHKTQILVQRTATIYASKDIDQHTENIIFLIHGYAQSAQDYLDLFSQYYSDNINFIAPEGLSKFYREGISGNVVASWMTSSDRQNEIEDYINYFDQLYAQIKARNPAAEISLIAFSQGVSTACRWVNSSSPILNHIILSGSIFPDDLPFEYDPESPLSDYEIYFQFGTEDRLLQKAQVTMVEELSQKYSNLHFKQHKGRHEMFVDEAMKITVQ